MRANNDKINEYEFKLNEFKQKNEELKLSIIQLKQEKERLTEHFHSLEEEYSLLVNRYEIEEQKEKKQQPVNSVSQNNQREEEESNFIINEFEQILKAALYKRHEYLEKEEKIPDFNTYNLLCNCVLVIFITSEDIVNNTYKILCQTFKIDSTTTFRILKNTIIDFWKPSQVEDYEYKLKLIHIDGTLKNISDESERIDTFLKQISNNNLARFVFYLDSDKLTNLEMRIKSFIALTGSNWNNKDLKEKEKEETEEIAQGENEEDEELIKEKDIDMEVEWFIKEKFVGLYKYAIKKFNLYKNRNFEKKKAKEVKPSKIWLSILSFFARINYFLYSFLIIYPLLKKVNPALLFTNRSTIESIFILKENEEQYMTKTQMFQSLSNIISPLFKGSSFSSSIALVSPLRTIFYRVKKNGRCKSKYISQYNILCYNSEYSSSNKETSPLSSWNSLTYINSIIPSATISDYDITAEDGSNYVNSVNELSKYYQSIFLTFKHPRNDKILSSSGELGSYKGKGYIFEVNPQYINEQVYQTAVDITMLDNELYDHGLRGIEQSFTFYHYPSNYFYFNTILYETNIDGSIKGPFVNVHPFKMNLYLGKQGVVLLIIDILSLIPAFVILANIIITIIKRRKKRLLKGGNVLGYNIKFIFCIISISFHLASLSIEFITFYNKNPSYGKTKTTSEGYLSIENSTDYYHYAFFFEVVKILECISLFFLVIHILIKFFTNQKIKILTSFLYQSVSGSFSYYIVFICLVISLSIIFNNIYGNYIADFSTIESSLTWVFLFAIGHFNSIIQKEGQLVYNILLMLFISISIRLLLNSMLLVNYIDIYRKICLKKGYISDLDEIAYETEREKKREKEEESKESVSKEEVKEEEEFEEIEIEEEVEEEIEEEEEKGAQMIEMQVINQ